MYYAAVNSHATETSIGFTNTWGVIGFATRQTRDAYVHRATDLATRITTTAEFKKYGAKRGQVSYYDKTGSFFSVYRNGSEIVSYRTGMTIDPVTAKPITSGCSA